MKKVIFTISTFSTFSTLLFGCKTAVTMESIKIIHGAIILPAFGEYRIWNNVEHPSFSVALTNANIKQTCEIYNVSDNGKEKKINPSLLTGKTLNLTVHTNGHLFIKNMNSSTLSIDYKIE